MGTRELDSTVGTSFSYGNWETGTIASSGTSTGVIDLGREFQYLCIILPSLTSGTIKVQVSDAVGGTYQDLGKSVLTATSTGGYSTTFKIGGYQFIKVVSSASQGAARTVTVRGMG